MAGLKGKVKQWQEAGLIEPAQADAIFTYEKERKRGKFGRGIGALGIFSILTGIVSVIAANWYLIPAEAKIGAHLLLNIIVAIVAYKAAANGRDMVREGAALALFGLTLTFMVLTGQVYQLEGSLSGLTAGWMILTLPFIAFFGYTRITAIPWMIAFLVTVTVVMSEQLQALPEFWQIFFAIAVGTHLPLCLIGDGSLKIFQRLRPAYAETFTRTGFGLLAINASLASFYWYVPRSEGLFDVATKAGYTYNEGYMIVAAIFLAAVAGIAFHAALCRFYRDNAEHKIGVLFVLASVLMIALPVLVPGPSMNLAAALIFIAYWVFIGWLGQQLAWSRLISLAIVLVAIRIFAIYVEVFGDMLQTGFGLIIGGSVVLVLIWAARKMNRALTPGGVHG